MYIHAHYDFDFFVDFNDIFNRLKHIDLFFRFPKEKLWEKYDNRYKIISLGSDCAPRMYATWSNLKPSKEEGEKTCPFDLCVSPGLWGNAELIENKFKNFFDGIKYDEEKKHYLNEKKGWHFIHDGGLSFEEFKEKYKNRINNFYEYLNLKDKYLFFLLKAETPTKEQVRKLKNAIEKYRNKNYAIIILNQSKKNVSFRFNNVYLINNYFPHKPNYHEEIKNYSTLGARFYNLKLHANIIEIIKQNMRKFPV